MESHGTYEGGDSEESFLEYPHTTQSNHDKEGKNNSSNNPKMESYMRAESQPIHQMTQGDTYQREVSTSQLVPEHSVDQNKGRGRGRGRGRARGRRRHKRGSGNRCSGEENRGTVGNSNETIESDQEIYYEAKDNGDEKKQGAIVTSAQDYRQYDTKEESTSKKIQVSGFDTSLDEDVLLMYFENTKRSGGGAIEELQMNPSNTRATITFQDLSVIDRVLRKSHKLNGATLEVVEKKKSVANEKEDQSHESFRRMIEVSGLKSNTSKDMLITYFENKRKSGGGEVTDLQINTKTHRATITFADQSVIDRVLTKSHILNGATLKVVDKKETDANIDENNETKNEDSPTRVIEVAGFKSGISEEMLTMYFENTRRSGGGEVTHVQMNTQTHRATITFADQSVIDRVLTKSHILNGATLKVVEKKETDANLDEKNEDSPARVIEVAGFKSGTSEDTLTMYFENTRRSGGDKVTHVQMNTQTHRATITFADQSVIDRVLTKLHILNGATLKVVEKKETNANLDGKNEDSPARVIEVAGFKSGTSEDTLTMYFENTRRSGGDEVTHVQMNTKTNRATITFADQSVIDRVLAKSHKLNGVTLEVVEKKETNANLDGNNETKNEDSPARVIEVAGFKSGTSEDMLTMYFESTRRSGGGEVTHVQMNTQTHRATITFADQSVIDRVLTKSHILNGATLKVVEKKETNANLDGKNEDSPARVIEVAGFKSGTSEDTLTMYFENTRRSGGDEVTHVQMNKTKHRATITFADQSVIDRVLAKSHKLNGVTLEVVEKKETNANLDGNNETKNEDSPARVIEVAGFKSGTSEDTLTMYFENTRRSGGDEVTHVQMNTQTHRATITFADQSVIDRVLTKSHILNGATLKVVEKKETDGNLDEINEDSPARVIEVAGLKSSISEEMLTMYFENTRRSGGDEITHVQMNTKTHRAVIAFADQSVIDRVLTKSHTLNGVTLEVVEKKEPDDLEDETNRTKNEDHPTRVIDVSGFKSSTSEDMLTMYFENTRRSGGGVITDLQMNTKSQRATITFADPSVIDQVVKKSHQLDKVKLTVVEKKARPHLPIDKHRIFLKGIPDDIQTENLMLFIENRTNTPVDPHVVYGEYPGTAMLYYVQAIQDLEKVIKKFGEKKIMGTVLTAERVKITDCILVHGLKPETGKDMIELYFENNRKSGGGAVRDIEVIQEDNKAVVFFENWADVSKVVGRSHTLMGKELTVTVHYACLGKAVSTEGPVPVIPKPIPHLVNAELMEHIMTKHSSSLAEELKKFQTEVIWPHNGNKSQTLLKPLPSESEDGSIWQHWKNTATKQMTDFIQKFVIESVQIPTTIWADLTDRIPEIDLGNVVVHQRPDKSVITLIGEHADVPTAKTSVLQAVRELTSKAEREAQIVQKKLKLTQLKIKLFSLFSFKDELNRRFPEVQTQVCTATNEIVFSGIRGEISETQVIMYGFFETLGNRIFETNPNVFEFLERYCEHINDVLVSKGLGAMCHVENGKATIYGKTLRDTENAHTVLQSDVICKELPVAKDSRMKALQSKQGSDQINSLNDTKVVACIDPLKREVRVTGLKDNVDNAILELGTFLDKHVIIEKLVQFPPLHVKYVLGNSGEDLSVIRNKYPDVSMLPQKHVGKSGFVINGNEGGIDAVASMLESLKSKLVQRKHQIDKSGMPELLRKLKGQRFLKTVETTCLCVIDCDNQMDVFEKKITGNNPPASSEILCHFTTTNGNRLLVCKGDLTKENVDAIVNAANSELKHIGGLAKAIVVAGGAEIQQESDRIIKQRRRNLDTCDAVCTNAGHLPCTYVIHVVGPIWPKGRRRNKSSASTSNEENLLYDAITNSLKVADGRKLTSIAIPAISAGAYGFPINLCAQTVVEATVDFMSTNDRCLQEIRFTNITVEHSVAFQRALKDTCGKDVVEGSPTDLQAQEKIVLSDAMYDAPRAVPIEEAGLALVQTPKIAFNKISGDTITTMEGKTIILKKGSIAEEQVDVIVNTTAGEMNLSRGNVSNALLLAAGPGLQQDCDDQLVNPDGTRQAVASGAFIQTGPANLKCKKVYHSHCPAFTQTDAVKVLQSMITELLLEASKTGMTSIALPAIGTGNLGFPRDATARIMYDAVAQFSKDTPASSLKDIRFWVYDKDPLTIQAFETEIQRRTTTNPAIDSPVIKTEPKSKRKMKRSSSAFALSETEREILSDMETFLPREVADSALAGSAETTFGSVIVRLQQGDLVKENTDAIVNTVGKDLALKGVVSRALIRAGGRVIAEECDKIKAVTPIPHIAKTTAGKLPCKCIIHVTLTGPDKVKKMTREILQLAEKEGLKSIAFPALGTGNLGGLAHDVAPEMLDAIGEFAANEKPTNLQLVKLVIFQQDMVPVFEKTMKSKAETSFKRSGSTWKRMKSVFKSVTGGTDRSQGADNSKTASTTKKEEQDSLSLLIVADEERKIDEAVTRIEEFITDEFYEEKFSPGDEIEFTDNILVAIRGIGEQQHVRITSLPGDKRILLAGVRASVFSVKADIQSHFTRLQGEEKRKAKDCLLSKEVQWRYKTDTGIYDDYDEDINAIIERAFDEKKPFVDLDMEDGTIRIDFARMVEIDVTSKREMPLHRADLKAETATNIPSNWIPMAAVENLKVVPLTQGSIEYNQVQTTATGAGLNFTSIVKIERIQNKEIYTQYTARKEQMKARLGNDTERILYHGTSQDTVDKINKRGFNRSFCGKNAVAYGKGTYFARDASYSAQDRYSPRDVNNHKFIYVCKVLVGDSEKGDSTMIVPHQKPNSTDIYDSTVDNLQNPSIIVIYHDAQAYQEYLMTIT